MQIKRANIVHKTTQISAFFFLFHFIVFLVGTELILIRCGWGQYNNGKFRGMRKVKRAHLWMIHRLPVIIFYATHWFRFVSNSSICWLVETWKRSFIHEKPIIFLSKRFFFIIIISLRQSSVFFFTCCFCFNRVDLAIINLMMN